jgi:hypothetical protein
MMFVVTPSLDSNTVFVKTSHGYVTFFLLEDLVFFKCTIHFQTDDAHATIVWTSCMLLFMFLCWNWKHVLSNLGSLIGFYSRFFNCQRRVAVSFGCDYLSSDQGLRTFLLHAELFTELFAEASQDAPAITVHSSPITISDRALINHLPVSLK